MTKMALAEPRNVIGFELKDSYHKASLYYVQQSRKQLKRSKKADLLDLAGAK